MVLQAHSDPLQMLAEGGLAAAVVVMTAGIFFIRRIEPPFRDPLRAALAAGAVAFALHSCVEFNAEILGNLFIFVAVLAALGAGEQARRSPLSRPVSRLAAVGFVLVIGWSVGRAAAWTIVAQVAEESADRFLAARRASSLDGDPSYLRQAAFASQKSGGREAWLAAEAALRAWPLDSRALELAGRALSSLGRAADGAELRARALKVFHG